ncbi:hypothetical protein DFR55_1059 [Herbinix hemicellulosilytica]|uniref:DUF3784 domain-containing protein n=1 Tax=Herbinix hemicellulosilytica TaxID=1564487 RepID=A0A0H5SI49_HERHM|nr:hypothetical protein [Herbinix hemicellulosilytica]RBP59527.1 hypothetical protein DFR55_1059 [Herbinix hemicellulosilytica]CRZ34760.1 hypothetical protein HHT355_1559 [Herbinix hemicellulosilytica]
MAMYEFFIVPEIFFVTGITLFSVLTVKSFKDMRGDIGLIYMNKDDLEKLSLESRRVLRMDILKVTLLITAITIIIGLVSCLYFETKRINLIICLILQILVSVIGTVPFFKKVKKLKSQILKSEI